jgi:protein-S-isoprenylcysteine O-methyltransferase Ste14
MNWLENRIPPPLVALISAGLMAAAGYASGPGVIDWPWRTAAAAVLFVAAGVFGPTAIRSFARAGTTIDPVHIERASELVTTGIFARTRNPMYVSMALLLASWAAWLGTLAPLLGPPLFVLYITRFQIMPEERALAARFGADHASTRERVARWL